jgi:hypothetical protein
MAISVVILVIDELNLAVVECEGQPPASTDAPMVRELSLEGMQSPA